MKKSQIVDLCVHCEGIDPEGKTIYKRENGQCGKCGTNSWILIEVREEELKKDKKENS